MPTGACRLTDADALGDLVTGPGCATVMIDALVASILGDMVVGETLAGNVSEGSPTVLFGGVAANRIGSIVEGTNVETGAEAFSTMLTGSTTVLVP